MTMQQICMTAALPHRLNSHWMKQLARRAGVSVDTARAWIYRGLPAARAPEVARAVLAEMDLFEAEIAKARAHWGKYVETPSTVGRNQAL